MEKDQRASREEAEDPITSGRTTNIRKVRCGGGGGGGGGGQGGEASDIFTADTH